MHSGCTPKLKLFNLTGSKRLNVEDDEDVAPEWSTMVAESPKKLSKVTRRNSVGKKMIVSILDDPDEYPDTPESMKEQDTGVEEYEEECQRLHAVPVSRFVKDPKVEELNLRHRGIGDKGVQALSVVLSKNAYMRSLVLDDNNIKDWGAATILEACVHARVLDALDISNNKIGGSGAAIAEFLNAEYSTVIELRLSGCRLKPAVAVFADPLGTNTWLRYLDLSNNDLDDPSVALLSSALGENSTIESLSLDSNKITSTSMKDLNAALKKNHSLDQLCLADNNLGDKGIETLFDGLEQCHLKSIVLGKVGATNLCCAAVARVLRSPASHLEQLVMSYNPLGEEGALQLVGALWDDTCLSRIDLSGTGIRDEVLSVILSSSSPNVQDILSTLPHLVGLPIVQAQGKVSTWTTAAPKTTQPSQAHPIIPTKRIQEPKNAAVSMCLTLSEEKKQKTKKRTKAPSSSSSLSLSQTASASTLARSSSDTALSRTRPSSAKPSLLSSKK